MATLDPALGVLSEGEDDGPQIKRARSLSYCESSLMNCSGSGAELAGLAELFGARSKSDYVSTGVLSRKGDGFFTLRMEHREGGPLARHRGEERILLFRSDKAGAIAKIIFSGSPASTARPSCSRVVPSSTNESKQELNARLFSQAKIHVLDVKKEYRGHDLGGLLFSEAAAALCHRYTWTECDTSDDSHSHPLFVSVRCQLDAEEDIGRHNKLVGFYEKLGCRVRPKAKVRYLDGIRKVPMEVFFQARHPGRERRQKNVGFSRGSLLGLQGGFLPVNLLEAGGSRLGVPLGNPPKNRRVDWLVIDDGRGHIQFRTTHGHCLVSVPDGPCSIVLSNDEDQKNEEPPLSPEWSNFQLYRASDHEEQSFNESDSDDDVRRQEFWVIQSSHGTFLSADLANNTLSCTKAPAYWLADKHDLRLVCSSDTSRREHYRKMWATQTVRYVTAMRKSFLRFDRKKLGIRDALDVVKSIPCHPFRVKRSTPSLRTLCFRVAEAARNAGHPDWVQFVALVHELGGVVNRRDSATATEEQDGFDWAIACFARVVGCAAPSCASFAEFRRDNPDESDDRYNSPTGMYDLRCGLSNVLLTWSGPEYMYHMLQHNSVNIPDEGLAILRLFSLGDWHTFMEYECLANSEDDGFRPFVAEFDKLRRCAKRECADIDEMTDEECDRLWEEHYSKVVRKYSGDGELWW